MIETRFAVAGPPLTVPVMVVKTVVAEKTSSRSPSASRVVPARLPGPVSLIATFAPWGVV